MAQRIALVRVLGVVGAVAMASLCMSSAPVAAENTYAEQEGSHGVNTFTNYHNASGMGPRIGAGQTVQVSCKVYDPYIQSVNPDGYWYRIATSPWNDNYYSPANTFMNGDPWGGPYSHNTDFNVPDCGAVVNPPPPPPPPPAANPAVSLARGAAASPGYWYAITLDHFAGGSAVSVSCYDSVSPGGFRTFTLSTDGNGHASTEAGCRSGDGPDHWIVANGIESNHVSWASAPAPPPPSSSSGSGPVIPPANPSTTRSAPATNDDSCDPPIGYYWIENNGLVSKTLYLHYLGGSGQPAFIDWAYFSHSKYFVGFATKLSVYKPGDPLSYARSSPNTDMFYSLGSFQVTRKSQNCYTVNDQYDFQFSHRSLGATAWSVITLPEWALKYVSAKEFDVYSIGRL